MNDPIFSDTLFPDDPRVLIPLVPLVPLVPLIWNNPETASIAAGYK